MTKVQIYTGEYLEQSLEELLEEIKTAIKGLYADCKIILFGSFARGEQTKDSDLDLCVLVPELTDRRSEMAVDVMLAIRRKLGKFSVPYELLLFTFDEFEEDKENEYLVQNRIFNEVVVLAG